MATRTLVQPVHPSGLEPHVQAIGRELFAHATRAHERLTNLNRWAKQVLSWCLSDPAVKSHVLRFIDCLPSLASPRDIVQHVQEYFPTGELRLPAALWLGASISRAGLVTAPAVAIAVRRLVEQGARQFIAGSKPEEAIHALQRAAARGALVSFDLLGELVVSEAEAEDYARRYVSLIDALGWATLKPEPGDGRPWRHVSLKPSSLSARIDPLDYDGSLDRMVARLRPILDAARRAEVAVTLDMEHYAMRDLTIDLAKRLVDEQLLPDGALGIVVQAYLADSETVVEELLHWLTDRKRALAVRLVKGAYWDSEIAHARQQGWPIPVYQTKWRTDLTYERLTARLLGHPSIRLEVASHNLRSIAYAMALAQQRELSPRRVEFQLLYGMGDAIEEAVRALGYPVRIYTPIGELIPGMAYLVRRILENTANESFLRHDLVRDRKPEKLLRPPGPAFDDHEVARTSMEWQGEPCHDFSRRDAREAMARAIAEVRAQRDRSYPLVTAAGAKQTDRSVEIRNPARPEDVIGRVAQASAADVSQAVEAAVPAQRRWAAMRVEERTAILRRAAELLRQRRHVVSSWETLEVGKTWREADADVAEAIDYLDYYSDQMEQLAHGRPLPQRPGEHNTYIYAPRGVAAVISPWNFPAAILTGMASAALAGGNAVIIKPARQSSIVASHVIDALIEAGMPAGVVQCLSGPGGEVGAALVSHPRVDMVLFTGSREVGCGIMKVASELRPGQRGFKHLVLELGGKNAIIVDADADLDAAVQGALHSAFSYQGQKCSAASRLIVHRAVYDRFLERLVAATDRLVVGDPADPGVDMGPMIDAAAQRRLREAVDEARRDGKLAYAYPSNRLPQQGYFVGPTIATDLPPTHRLAREELFGPLVCVFRADSFKQALALANDCDYALTGGVYSRLPSHLRLAENFLEAGNIYLNRPITGALVARQPFGGYKLSGLGTKAGGPDYLLQVLIPKTICENTTRHGMPLD